MFCSNCGSQTDARARFCAACGTARESFTAAPPPRAYRSPGPLMRSRSQRMIAGVCAGFADHYGWDLGVVRVVVAVMALLTSGAALLAYLAAWVIIPEGQYALPYPTPPPPTVAPPFESQTT
jgi:phage shock protein C